MDLLIVTGMSGAGKSQAAHALEDIGFYCVDNIPPLIIPNFTDLFMNSESSSGKSLAIITDIRGGELFGDIITVLDKLAESKINYKILYLTASSEVLIRRYKENRRRHPLCNTEGVTVGEAVAKERGILEPIKARADYIIDTSETGPTQFKQQISALFFDGKLETMDIQCISFGFKYGIPSDADMVFDVRCLPNPFSIESMRNKTGLDKNVRDYVMNSEISREFLNKITDFIDFTVPQYELEGKSQLTVAFGCTGGKHRSVTFAELLNEHLLKSGHSSITVHRDIYKL